MAVEITDSREFVLEAGAAVLPQRDGQTTTRNVSILVRDDKIAAVEVGRTIDADVPRLRMPGQLLLPGMISCHTHVASAAPTRALIEPRGGNYAAAIKLGDQLSEEDTDAMTAFHLAELICTGCTTQVEMSLSLKQAQSYARVATSFGARGYPGGMVPNTQRLTTLWQTAHGPLKVFSDKAFTESIPATLAEIQANLNFGRDAMDAGNGRIRPMMAAHATDTHTPETMRALLVAAKELGTGLQIHMAQSTEESQSVFRRWGLRSVEWVDSLGMFEIPIIGAHMFGADLLHDPAILAKRPYLFATCPFDTGVNGRLQPYPEMLAAGVAVGIGVDAHNMDFIETLKMAVVKGQARHTTVANPGVPSKPPTIDDAVLGATRVSADFLGRPDLGRLAVGAKADIVSVDVTGLLAGTARLSPEPMANLLYSNGSHTRNVIIDGQWKVHDGAMLFADPVQLQAGESAAVAKIWDRLEESGWLGTHTPEPPRATNR